MSQRMWHILDASNPSMKEFGAALSRIRSVTAWVPSISSCGLLRKWTTAYLNEDPLLRIVEYPLQRGYHFMPRGVLSPMRFALQKRLSLSALDDEILVC